MYVVCACCLLGTGDLFHSMYIFKIYHTIAMDIYIEREGDRKFSS